MVLRSNFRRKPLIQLRYSGASRIVEWKKMNKRDRLFQGFSFSFVCLALHALDALLLLGITVVLWNWHLLLFLRVYRVCCLQERLDLGFSFRCGDENAERGGRKSNRSQGPSSERSGKCISLAQRSGTSKN